jgi:hypothetical protein
MDPIFNERVKLAATALNTLATASVAVGVLAPLSAILYGLGVTPRPLWQIVLSAVVWLLIGGGLHYGAQRLLGRLRP